MVKSHTHNGQPDHVAIRRADGTGWDWLDQVWSSFSRGRQRRHTPNTEIKHEPPSSERDFRAMWGDDIDGL